MIDRNIFSINKMAYCRGERPKVDCILCEIINHSGKVEELEVYRNDLFMVCVNLFPYHSGHLLIAPLRHIVDVRDMTEAEQTAVQTLLNRTLDILDSLYAPHGYNIGYNIGHASGASIPHIHMHIVPRYENELGFVDIISGSKLIVEDPVITQKRLRGAFAAH